MHKSHHTLTNKQELDIFIIVIIQLKIRGVRAKKVQVLFLLIYAKTFSLSSLDLSHVLKRVVEIQVCVT